jgi:RNA polymerase sigma factor (TIGR02999 family)
MTGADMTEVTRLLDAIGRGDPEATAKLMPLLYEELRELARAQMARERPGHTLQATALVHEAFLRLVQEDRTGWQGRSHFFAAAAEAMRRILIEHARAKHALKRGGRRQQVELAEEIAHIESPCTDHEDLLALDEALERFSGIDPEKAKLVKLLYFAGLNLAEAAAALGISRSTAYRHWLFARAWLHNAMAGRENPT